MHAITMQGPAVLRLAPGSRDQKVRVVRACRHGHLVQSQKIIHHTGEGTETDERCMQERFDSHPLLL
jgi:hypothetical protein